MASPRKALTLKVVRERSARSDHGPLSQRTTARDESAFTFFFEATSGLLFGLLLLTLRDTATAEEILSEVYDEMREQIGRLARRSMLDTQSEYSLNWLITTAHRRAFDRLRANRSGERERFTVSAGSAQQGRLPPRMADMSAAEDQELVSSTLAALSHAQRKMIELAYFSRQTPREIALRLGQPVEQVKADLQDGMLKLYKLFKNIPAERSLNRRPLADCGNHKQRRPPPPAPGEKPARDHGITLVRSTR